MTALGDSADLTALAAPDRPLPVLRHTLVLARRAVRKSGRTPESWMDVIVQPVLFLLLFAYLFGAAVSGSPKRYTQYLVPGLLVQTLLLATVAVGVNLNADVRGGVFDRFRSLPIARCAPLLGAALAEVVRYLAATVVTVGVGYLLGWRPDQGIVAAIGGCALAIGFAFCLSWLPVLVGLTARTPGAVQGVLLPVMFPLTFGSNVFVPMNSVPGWLQAFVKVNPVSQVTASTRALMDGGALARPLLWTLLWMVGLLAVLVPASVAAYRARE
ncbi:MAG: ABC transporter permease [Jatrophihabitans sp.]